MVKGVDVGRKKWLFAEKDEGRSHGRKRGALRRAISGRCGPGFVKAFSAACRQFGCLVRPVTLVTVHECIICVALCMATNYSSNCILDPTVAPVPSCEHRLASGDAEYVAFSNSQGSTRLRTGVKHGGNCSAGLRQSQTGDIMNLSADFCPSCSTHLH